MTDQPTDGLLTEAKLADETQTVTAIDDSAHGVIATDRTAVVADARDEL